jgi:hypothetical protein
MRARASPLLPVALALMATACGPRYAHLVERELPADGLVCPGYLVWNDEPVRHVFLVINGSGTGSSAFLHPTFDGVVSTRSVAYATYDKPGISAPFDDPAAARRDDAILERYTLGHGVACATQALRWAREHFGSSARLHLRGHSEGTLVALYVYDALLEEDPELAASIDSLVLSGLALEPFDEILERQLTSLPDGEAVREAIASCDWTILAQRMGVSCAYIDDASQRPSGLTMFERLAARSAPASFYVFHGTEDWHTPVEPVRALEAWNASTGHLEMELHYYQGGHGGSDAVRAEMTRVIDAIVAPPARQ